MFMSETIKNHQIKITIGTGIAVLLFVIYTTISANSILNAQQNHLDQHDIKSDVIDERTRVNEKSIKELSSECQRTAVSYAEIKTRLAGIETLLLEMRQQQK